MKAEEAQKLDEQIALALGYTVDGGMVEIDGFWFIIGASEDTMPEFATPQWHPSTSDADAFVALDKWIAINPDTKVSMLYALGAWKVGLGWHYSLLYEENMASAGAATRAEAVCRCILAAAGVERRG